MTATSNLIFSGFTGGFVNKNITVYDLLQARMGVKELQEGLELIANRNKNHICDESLVDAFGNRGYNHFMDEGGSDEPKARGNEGKHGDKRYRDLF